MYLKKRSYVLVLMFILVLIAFTGRTYPKKKKSEKGHLVVTYDFLNKKISDNMNDRYIVYFRRHVTCKVVNVNPFLFKTEINGKPFNLPSVVPKLFKDVSKDTPSIEEKKDTANQAAKKTKETQAEIVNSLKKESKKKNGKSNDAIFFKLKVIKTEFDKINSFISAYMKLQNIEKINLKLGKILYQNKSYNLLLKSVQKLFQKELEFIGKSEDSIVLCEKTLQNANIAYKAIDLKYLKNESYKSDKFKELFNTVKNYKSNMDKFVNAKIIENISSLLANFQQINFERSIMIPNIEDDGCEFLIKITSLNEEKATVHQKVIGPIQVRVKRGWTFNFSTGIMLHINAHNRTFRFEPKDNDPETLEIIENKNKYSITPTITAILHVYPRSIRSLKWGGISFGIGTNDTERINYYLGTSCMFGFKKRFVINAGFVLSKIDMLKAEYKDKKEVALSDNLKPETLVNKEYIVRFFVGFTYNL